MALEHGLSSRWCRLAMARLRTRRNIACERQRCRSWPVRNVGGKLTLWYGHWVRALARRRAHRSGHARSSARPCQLSHAILVWRSACRAAIRYAKAGVAVAARPELGRARTPESQNFRKRETRDSRSPREIIRRRLHGASVAMIANRAGCHAGSGAISGRYVRAPRSRAMSRDHVGATRTSASCCECPCR